jgi:hypothetical protein
VSEEIAAKIRHAAIADHRTTANYLAVFLEKAFDGDDHSPTAPHVVNDHPITITHAGSGQTRYKISKKTK